MTVREALRAAAARLANTADTPQLDAVVLLSHAAGWPKERTLASYPEPLHSRVVEEFQTLVERRAGGMPVSYIRGTKEFYGLEFEVGPGVLVPRPETELLVELCLQMVAADPGRNRILDCCTGSGCVAVTLKHELPRLAVFGSDVSPEASDYFIRNSTRILGYPLPFIRSDLFAAVETEFDIIVCNPPYLTTEEVDDMAAAAWPEPRLALDGGTDGLDLIRRIVCESRRHLRPGGRLVMEAASAQIARIEKLYVQNSYQNITIGRDLSGRPRTIYGTHKQTD